MGSFSTFLFKKLFQRVHTLVIECVVPPMATLFCYFLECVNPFWFHLSYFTVVSLIGFLALKATNTRYFASSRPDNLDVFFTSVSASTLSSMTVIEMEVFSTSQLVIMIILMFLGGDVFVSMISLVLRSIREPALDKVGEENTSNSNQINQLELGNIHSAQVPNSASLDKIKNRAMKTLARVIFGYLIVIHSLGSSLVSLYISLTPSARDTLNSKGLSLPTFSIFLIVSTFANCGLVPTNENMISFRKNPGLLLIAFPQILLGNTLFPCCLRLVIWVCEKLQKGEEYTYLLNNYKKLGFSHLFSTFNTCMLAATALGFVALQFVLFCAMEWSNVGLQGLSSYEKLIGSLFQAMNARHSGESILDVSTISTSIIVLFVVMMYLPPYTMFIPTWKKDEEKEDEKDQSSITKELQRKSILMDFMNMILSPLSTFCKRRINVDESCKDMWFGFSGRWSKEGKIILIVVMLYGRLKKFYMQGGQGWHLM
ncbi:hypothetical protein V2J09_002381 [Rumex salicifolius]